VAISRPYERDSDLRLMQRLASECYPHLGARTAIHVGDLTWWMYQRVRPLGETPIQLWLEDGECVAFASSWLSKDAIDWVIHPERAELVDDVLAWAAPADLFTTEDDSHGIARIEATGYSRVDANAGNHMHRELDALPDVRVADGYTVRPVRGPDDLHARVDVHRIVWAPSRVTYESYARLMREWPYRPDLDYVVEAPDGTFAAFCLSWFDPDNRVGLFEPVGTHPDHRRRGLGAAVCTAALHGLKAAGATAAFVGSEPASGAQALYESIGFQTVTRFVRYGKKDVQPGV
jgi:ribosomal protein S18 acetylase RimI-like enzyme